MGDTIFYMRSSSPDPSSQSQLRERFIDDLRKFVEFEKGKFQSAIKALQQAPKFLVSSEVPDILWLGEEWDELEAKCVGRIVSWLNGNIESKLDFIRLINLLESAEKDGEPEDEQVFTKEQIQTLQERLRTLIDASSSLLRQKKAEELGTIVGQRLEKLHLINDLRPIFDANRKQVEGFLPVTTMHIVVTGADGLPNALDVILSEADVERIAEQAEFAKNKIQALKKIVQKLNITIPETGLTTAKSDHDNVK